MHSERGARAAVAFFVTVLMLDAAPAATVERHVGSIQVLSSRADVVSGGDALVEYRTSGGRRWSALLSGHDVTRSFRRVKSNEWIALLTGLRDGNNSLKIRQFDGVLTSIDLVNHPISGPIFSGPHQKPFVCQTEQNGLGPPLDTECSAKTVIKYYYKPLHPAVFERPWIEALEAFAGKPADVPPGFKFYNPEFPPTDVATTITTKGRTVPYIVRREIGVINRAVYDIRFLHQPGQPLPNPWSEVGSSWNGRLVYELSGGCRAAYRQGTLLTPASHEAILAQGYAVATATLNVFVNNCNDVLSAETVSMVKEHFAKEYGAPIHTIGWGDSAGAMQQYLIAQNYPGLLDGIIPYISFPDTVTYVPSSSDCGLLIHAFDRARSPWTDQQKTAATGFATWRVCSLGLGKYAISPLNCDAAIPPADVYDPNDRPKGVRCDIYDNEINVFGRDPKTGYAARPLDNVGVQYGLATFNTGKIDAEQFVELNELIGGLDADGNFVPQRTIASTESIDRAYGNGLVLTGGGGLADTPIIDWRWYSDDQGDNHDSLRSLVTRARLIAANGTAANQVILIDPPANTSIMMMDRVSDPDPESSIFARRERDLVREMDRWLDNIASDRGSGTRSAKVARDKPAEVADSCWTVAGEHIEAGDSDFGGRCARIYPPHSDPRIVAGAPLTDDVLKCVLKPIRAEDYTQSLGAEQLQRLRAVFPTGVCDYTRPGVGQKITAETWQSY